MIIFFQYNSPRLWIINERKFNWLAVFELFDDRIRVLGYLKIIKRRFSHDRYT